MGASSIEHIGGFTIVRFHVATHDGESAWPAAMVVWHGDRWAPEPGFRARWRAFRYRRGIGRLQLNAGIRHAPMWMGYAGPAGERETLFEARRQVVRVLDREFSIPAPGETLVLLLGDDQVRSRRPITRVVSADLTALESGVGISTTMNLGPIAELDETLVQLSQTDPEVRAWMEGARQ